MVMKALRDGAQGGISKFILFGFMVLATGGLVMMDVGGFFRGGVSSGDVAKVGDQSVPVQYFDQTVRRTLSRLGTTPQEAYRMGYINQLLGGEIRAMLLSQAASENGVAVGDKPVARQIHQIMAPYTSQGQDPKTVLNQILLNQGMSERAFVNSIARDMGTSLLTDALQSGAGDVNEDLAKDLLRFQSETRDIEYITFMHDDLKDIPAPSDEQLQTFYQNVRESFSTPETRRLKLVTLNLSSLKDTLDISDELVRQSYDDNIDLYTVQAQRTLQQALLQDEEQAKAVINSVNDGKSLESAVQDVTGNTASYLGQRDFEESGLIEDVKADVMAAEKDGAVLGPITSPLGYYVVVVKKISPEKVKSFDEVRADIKNELQENALIDEQYAMANMVDDLMASGVSLEDVSEEVDIEVQTLPEINQYGQNSDGKNALEDYGQSGTYILESGFELLEGETSPIFETQDGKMMAVNVDTVTEKSYKSFEEAKDQLKERWMADQRRVGTRVLATQFLTEMNAELQSIADVAKTHDKQLYTKAKLERNKDPEGKLNQRSVADIFEVPMGEAVLVDIDGGVAIARITDFDWPETIDTSSETYKTLYEALSEGASEEALNLYLQEKQREYGAKVNQALLDKVYGPESQTY